MYGRGQPIKGGHTGRSLHLAGGVVGPLGHHKLCSVFKHILYKLWRKPREERTDFTSSHEGEASPVPVVQCVTLYESPHPVLFNLTNLSSLLRLKHNTVKTSSTENKQREINGKQPRCVRPTFCGFSVKVSRARAHSGGP